MTFLQRKNTNERTGWEEEVLAGEERTLWRGHEQRIEYGRENHKKFYRNILGREDKMCEQHWPFWGILSVQPGYCQMSEEKVLERR